MNNIFLGTVKLSNSDYGFSRFRSNSKFNSNIFLKNVELLGINKFDTSPRYGDSEKILGNYFKLSKTKPVVSSKIDCLYANDSKSKITMIESVRKSLDNLYLDNLDICYLHQNDINIISDHYVHEGIDELKSLGLINAVGSSIYSLEEYEYSINSGIFDYVQIPINVIDLSFYKYLINKKSKIKIVARSILLQGVLANKESYFSKVIGANKLQSRFDLIDSLAADNKMSRLEFAISTVLSLGLIHSFIIGSTSISHIKEIINLSNQSVSDESFRLLLKMNSKSHSMTNPKNWNFIK